MNVEIGTEAAQCPEKEYINGIFVAAQRWINARKVHLFKLHVLGEKFWKNTVLMLLKKCPKNCLPDFWKECEMFVLSYQLYVIMPYSGLT